MSLAGLLAELRSRDIRLSARGERLSYSAPPHALDEALRAELGRHKSELLDLLREEGDEAAAAAAPEIDAPHEITSAQARLLFLDDLGVPPELYAMHLTWRCSGALDATALELGVQRLIERHDALRTVFERGGEGLRHPRVQSRPTARLERVDLRASPREALRRAADMVTRPIDLERGPPLRARLFELGDESHLLCIVLHHAVVDGWSLALLKRDLAHDYACFSRGRTPAPSGPVPPYAAYGRREREWLESQSGARALRFWREHLAGAPPATALPFDYPRRASPSYAGGSLARRVPRETLAALESLARAEGATLFMVLFAAFNAFLHRYTGELDLVVGTVVANRREKPWQEVVGLFANALALRTRLDPTQTYRSLLAQVRRTVLAALDAQQVPFDAVVRTLDVERDPSVHPIFQVLFVLQDASGEPFRLDGLELEPVERLGPVTAKFDLALEVRPTPDGGREYHLNYATALFSHASIERMADHLDVLLASLPEAVERRLDALPLAPGTLDGRVAAWWNEGPAPPAPSSVLGAETLDEAFRRRRRATPDACALVDGEERHDYRRLADAADVVSAGLARAGCLAGEIVCISLPRSADYVACVLGVLARGALWCPIDPGYPQARRALMIEDSGARFHLCDPATAIGCAPVELDTGRGAGPQRLTLERDPDGAPRLRTLSAPAPAPSATQRACAARRHVAGGAYLVYTSGSSGPPKGVVGTHRGALARIAWMASAFPAGTRERCAIRTATSFVDSLSETFGPLLTGMPGFVLDDGCTRDVRRLVAALARLRVTRVVVVPSLLQALLDQLDDGGGSLPDLALCVTSGESLSSALARRCRTRLPHVRLLNLYGASEVSGDCLWHEVVDPPGRRAPPLGRPLPGSGVYLLDGEGRAVPDGARGEICVAGAHVALGYHERLAATAVAFVQDPFRGGPMYRTGDQGRRRDDGAIEYLGRNDRQRKLRGFRVDCAEVESAVESCDGVARCHVDVVGEPGRERLRASIECLEGATLERSDVSRHARERLPAHLVPSSFAICARLPLTPSGKVDPDGLDALHERAARFETSPSDTEGEPDPRIAELIAIWERVLGRAPIGPDDDFFALGGHSLLAARLLSRAERALGREIALSAVFEAPTVRRLLARVDADASRDGDEASSLMALRPLTDAPALFLLPPVGATGMYFRSLVGALPESLAVYSFDTMIAGDRGSIEALAAHYADELRRVRPHGPWFLGGTCFGNHIAQEVARQLHEATGRTSSLFLIDSSPPLNGPGWDYRPARRARARSPVRFYAGVLLHQYRVDRFASLFARQRRRLLRAFNATVREYAAVQRALSPRFERFRASPGRSDLRLYLSAELAGQAHLLDRWRRLTSGEFSWRRLPARSHRLLVAPGSEHWRTIAEDIGARIEIESRAPAET